MLTTFLPYDPHEVSKLRRVLTIHHLDVIHTTTAVFAVEFAAWHTKELFENLRFEPVEEWPVFVDVAGSVGLVVVGAPSIGANHALVQLRSWSAIQHAPSY